MDIKREITALVWKHENHILTRTVIVFNKH